MWLRIAVGLAATFGAALSAMTAAQARGDLAVLLERDRRALRIHLGTDVQTGLTALREALTRALQGPLHH